MVAPTRTPQARGVKCDLCKRILTLATWLDQTKLAKKVEDASSVLDLINQHTLSECPCIPKNIEYLLIGSTHFELHRLLLWDLDSQVHRRQSEIFRESRRKNLIEASHVQTLINDCYDTKRESRFKIYQSCFETKQAEKAELQLQHLKITIDYWNHAMEDQANPFNSKLALRLGLTHHIVYACYYFKFYKILNYQLQSAILLLNVFKSVEAVTANAILHAYYLVIRALLDCSQKQLARRYIKQATVSSNYSDKSHYEAILLTCAECELRLLDESETDKSGILEDLATLVTIDKDDKLQHYYARTLALSTIIRFMHQHKSRSDNCYEFFHTYRFVCAIIRRCYESSFDLVLSDKDPTRQHPNGDHSSQQPSILDHNWIRFAVCDFSFATFNLLKNFYMRAGMPECLELLFNGLSLIAFRTGSVYWQSRIYSFGIEFDLLCSKFDDAEKKLRSMSRISSFTNDTNLMNLLRLESEVCKLTSIKSHEDSIIRKSVILHLLERIKNCQRSQLDQIQKVRILDCKTSSDISVDNVIDITSESTLLNSCAHLLELGLTMFKAGIATILKSDPQSPDAKYLVKKLHDELGKSTMVTLEFYAIQMILEVLLEFTSIDTSEQQLLDAVNSSELFLSTDREGFNILSEMSSLNLGEKTSKTKIFDKRPKSGATKNEGQTSKTLSRKYISRRSKRKGTYEVAIRSTEDLPQFDRVNMRSLDPLEALGDLWNLSREEILLIYLRYSDPNPNYLLYRRVHELMLCSSLSAYNEDARNHDGIFYYFSESISSNTMRYRWMMYEEQQVSPFDPMSTKSSMKTKYLTFSNSQNMSLRLLTRSIPDDIRVNQIKYICDKRTDLEHLLIVSFDVNNEPVAIHAKRALLSDEFFDDALRDDKFSLTIPKKLETKIEESKRLLLSGVKVRSIIRDGLESDIRSILYDMENEWLGCFRFIFCARVNEINYQRMINELVNGIDLLMIQASRSSGATPKNKLAALRMLLEGAPLLVREEFCRVISMLYNCLDGSNKPRDCYNMWLKSIEIYVNEQGANTTKVGLLKKLSRGQLAIILDKQLESIPIESLPAVLSIDQGMFRVPSLRLMAVLSSRKSIRAINSDRVAYVLDPANNLAKTRERFDQKLKTTNKNWMGVIGQPPKCEQLECWLSQEELYIFIGHGAGTAYYNKLGKGKGLSAMTHIESAAIVMGCSSGRMIAEGPELESFGIGWLFVFRGAPFYMGLLWDVTDADIDKFTDTLLTRWMPCWSLATSEGCHIEQSPQGGDRQAGTCNITDASSIARHVCRWRALVGSTPVVYGLPVPCR